MSTHMLGEMDGKIESFMTDMAFIVLRSGGGDGDGGGGRIITTAADSMCIIGTAAASGRSIVCRGRWGVHDGTWGCSVCFYG